MKLNKGRIVILAAVAIIGLLAIPTFAACPPGTIDITTLGSPANITAAGTYCIPATGAWGTITVAASNVTIVGETDSAPLWVTPGNTGIVVNGGLTGIYIQSFTVNVQSSSCNGIDAGNSPAVIQKVTFDDSGNGFSGYAVRLSGTAPVVRNCTFKMQYSNAPAILLDGGSGAKIYGNSVFGSPGHPYAFILNTVSSYNNMKCYDNTVDHARSFIDLIPAPPGGQVPGFTSSSDPNKVPSIYNNNCGSLSDVGISLGSSNSIKVENNVMKVANGPGIVDAGGSGMIYQDNDVTSFGPALSVTSGNAIIKGNTLRSWGGDGIVLQPNASGAKIQGNTILQANTGIWAANKCSSLTITGNDIQKTTGDGIRVASTSDTISGNSLTNITGWGIVSGGNSPGINKNILNHISGGGVFVKDSDIVSDNILSDISGNPAIWVVGNNATITGNKISNVSNAPGIIVQASNCTIDNNIISDVTQWSGILITANNTKSISGNSISSISNGYGINLGNTNGCSKVDGNTISDVYKSGIYVGGQHNKIDGQGKPITDVAKGATAVNRWAGIQVVGNADYNTISNTKIVNAGSAAYAVGIDLYGWSGAVPDHCTVTGNTLSEFTRVSGSASSVAIGIRVDGGTDNSVSGNTISNSGNLRVGIDILGSNQVVISNNTIKNMTKDGLRLRGGNHGHPLLVKGNNLVNNVIGISMESGAAQIGSANISGTDSNHIIGGSTALYLGQYSTGDEFWAHGNCIDAPVLVNNEGLSSFDVDKNYWGTKPVTGVNIFGMVNNFGPTHRLSTCPSPGGVTPQPGSGCCTYKPGWNLISMPVVPSSTTIPTALKPYVNKDPKKNLFWQYDPAYVNPNPQYGHSKIPTIISSSEGYWIYIGGAPVQICIQGSVPKADQNIVLTHKGWHIIGTYITGAYWANTTVTYNGATKTVTEAASLGWVSPIAYGYAPDTGKYYGANALQACHGYWVKTYENNITLTIPYNKPPSGPASPAASVSELSPDLLPPPPPPLLPTPGSNAGGLVFTNEPNPVTDVHTTTFVVKGAMASSVKAVKVAIYDLSGRLVYDAEKPGTSIIWHTENNDGEYLANGVYLYMMYARVDGKWAISDVKKVVILR